MAVAVNKSETLFVLVVEDEFFVRYDIAEYLRECGCVVIEEESAAGALAVCRNGTPVDVLFTDINLNGSGTGWDVAEAARAMRPDIAVFYASGELVDRSRCVPGGLFFSKPYSSSDILKACRQLTKP